MTCGEFYDKTKAMIKPTGLNAAQNGSVKNVYFGTGHNVIFHNQWNADNLSSLMVLEDLNSWRGSTKYIEAHYCTANDGTSCVSLSATSDSQYENDVTGVQLTANSVEVQGYPRNI